MPLVLDRSTHTYTDNGIVLPSVTQCLKAAGFFNYGQVNKEILERAAKFGSAVHKACALEDRNNLGECDVALLPYLDGWRNFKQLCGLDFIHIEKSLSSKMYGFAGTPDRLFSKDHKVGYVVDIKTGQYENWHSVQCVGYELLFRECRKFKQYEHWIIYLNPKFKEGFKIEPVARKEIDLNKRTFLAALQITHWKMKHKKGNEYDTDNGTH